MHGIGICRLATARTAVGTVSTAHRRVGRRLGHLVAMGAVAALTLAACGPGGAADPTSGATGGAAAELNTASGSAGATAATATLKLAATASGPFTEQFNPLVISSQTANGYAVLNIYQQLLTPNYTTGVLQPLVVSTYEWGADGKSLTLHITPGGKWSDGTDLTADDVAFTFNLLQKYPALNGQSLPLDGADATSKDTVVLKFSEPAFQAVWWRTSVVPKAIWSKVEDPVKYANPKPVGSGPFELQTFSPQVITLKANPYYAGPGTTSVGTVQYLAYDSDSSAVAALQAGQVDWISPGITNPKAVADRAPGKVDYWVTPRSTGIIFLLPNLTVYPLSDLAVRQAINVALDREEISTVGLNGVNQPIDSPVGLNAASEGQAKLIAPEFQDLRFGKANPDEAKSILTKAGYKLGTDGVFVTPKGQPLTLQLMVPTSSAGFGDMVGAAQVMVKELAAAGIKLTVKAESPTAWRNDINVGNYQLSMRSVGGTLSFFSRYDKLLNQDELVPVGKKALANFERYKNPVADSLLAQYAGSAPGSDGEKAELKGLQEIMVNDLPVMPLYLNSGIGMWRVDHFTGWPSDANPYATSVAAEPSVWLILSTVKPVG